MPDPRDKTGLNPSGFFIRRMTDKEIHDRAIKLFKQANIALQRITFEFLGGGHSFDLKMAEGEANVGERLATSGMNEIFNLDTIAIKNAMYHFGPNSSLQIQRETDGKTRLTGNQDTLLLSPSGSELSTLEQAKIMHFAREVYEPLDTRPLLSFLSEDVQEFYRHKDESIAKLERLQIGLAERLQDFFLQMTTKNQELQGDLEKKAIEQKDKAQKEHEERLQALEQEREELRKLRQALDERDYVQARRDIFKELREKLKARNTNFGVTESTQGLRKPILILALAVMGIFFLGFALSYYRNYNATEINWAIVWSQFSFLALFVVTVFFVVRWYNIWAMKHADGEFRLQRLDLDIDRAAFLVELAMEWKKQNQSEIPPELVEKLGRNLFNEDQPTANIDIHPLETFFSGIAGKDGEANFNKDGFSFKRSDGKK